MELGVEEWKCFLKCPFPPNYVMPTCSLAISSTPLASSLPRHDVNKSINSKE